jgi:hypothetical protein
MRKRKQGMKNKPIIIVLTAAAYVALFEINTLLFSGISYATSVDWVYFPSGLRLAFVLIFGAWGALGIVLGSIAVSYAHYFNGDIVTAVGSGLVSGLAPLLARSFCVHAIDHFDFTLIKLTVDMLTKVAAMFAMLSATLHQLWFTSRGYSDHFIANTAVMAFGDFVGTFVVLYAAKYLLQRLPLIEVEGPHADLE